MQFDSRQYYTRRQCPPHHRWYNVYAHCPLTRRFSSDVGRLLAGFGLSALSDYNSLIDIGADSDPETL